jgi:hypothetical protein
MHRASAKVLAEYGAEGSRKLFLQLKPEENPNYPKGIEDNTHFNPFGAEVMAELAARGIREQRLGIANQGSIKSRVRRLPDELAVSCKECWHRAPRTWRKHLAARRRH